MRLMMWRGVGGDIVRLGYPDGSGGFRDEEI